MDLYAEIFKRRSFHLFRGTEKLSPADVEKIGSIISSVEPLYPGIKTEIVLVPESETTCRRGAEYCILFYSEKKGDYLRNIGYIGEQIDLALARENIGALWFGIGRTKEMQKGGLDYVIMIALSKMPEDKFRKDMFKSKRKVLDEIWSGDTLGVGEIARFAPSACNSQPWKTENNDGVLNVYRYRKPGKRGIMPANKVGFYNRIDVGIYLYILEVCLAHEGYSYERELFSDVDGDEEMTLATSYKIGVRADELLQTERITKYENIMREVSRLIAEGAATEELRDMVSSLEAYYDSVEWRRDFAADEAGLLPRDLSRGVLSEDGIYDLLEEYRGLVEKKDEEQDGR
ncbi:MAG: DUF4298 domain-containing protein [Clostridia bacterium]|nr:DUF4298 domain-containing protein [Clostridia bacterium]